MGIFELKGEDSWEYIAIHDDRCCDECDSYDGVVFTSSQIRRHFPYSFWGELIVYPMTHPHCRCALAKITAVPEITVTIPVDKGFGKVTPPKHYVPTIRAPPLSASNIRKIQRAIKVDLSHISLDANLDIFEKRTNAKLVKVMIPNESFIIRANKKGKRGRS